MISANIVGGLGNQLFIIFNAIAHAFRSNQPFVFIETDEHGGDNCLKRPTYWKTFLHKLKPYLIKEFPLGIQIQIVQESGFEYKNYQITPVNQDCVYMYDGYFQSYKYFQDVFEKICKMIDLGKFQTEAEQWFSEHNIDKNDTISMHFRIGDYKNLQHCHPLMTYEYYEKSLQTIAEIKPNTQTNVLYFCEMTDIDDVLQIINPLQTKFPNYTFIWCNDIQSDYKQLLLMSQCQYNIIANSTFSWWGAYLNTKPNKIVCYPRLWFGPGIPNANVKDLFPEEWISC
jgi:hypothetical protein